MHEAWTDEEREALRRLTSSMVSTAEAGRGMQEAARALRVYSARFVESLRERHTQHPV